MSRSQRTDEKQESSFRRVACEVVRQTDKAVLVQVDGEEYWLPLSQLDPSKELPEPDTLGVIHVAEWLAKQEHLPEADPDTEDDASITMFSCMRRPIVVTRRVRHSKFGDGDEVSVEGDKSIVQFADSRRTILTRFLTPC